MTLAICLIGILYISLFLLRTGQIEFGKSIGKSDGQQCSFSPNILIW